MIRYGQQSKFAKEVVADLEPLVPSFSVTELAVSDEKLDRPRTLEEAEIDDEDTPQ